MPKRTDRCKPIRHHQEQLEKLKTLDPIATPERWKPFSDALVDIAIAALDVAYRVEGGRKPTQSQVVALFRQVNSLLAHAPEKEDGHESEPVDSTAWQKWTQLQQAYQEAQQRLDAVKAGRASQEVSPLKLMQKIADLQREMDALLREHPQLVGGVGG